MEYSTNTMDALINTWNFIRIDGLNLILQFICTDNSPPGTVDVEEGFKNVTKADHLVYSNSSCDQWHFYVTNAEPKDGGLEVISYFWKGNENPLHAAKIFPNEPVKVDKMEIGKRYLREDADAKNFKKVFYTPESDFEAETKYLKAFSKDHKLFAYRDNNSEHLVTFIKTGELKYEESVWRKLIKGLTMTLIGEGILYEVLEDTSSENAITKLVQEGVSETPETALTVSESYSYCSSVKITLKKNAVRTISLTLLVDGGLLLWDLSNAHRKKQNGHLSPKDFNKYLIKQLFEAGGRSVGRLLGSLVGAVIYNHYIQNHYMFGLCSFCGSYIGCYVSKGLYIVLCYLTSNH